jgi:hypothetical protein
MRIYGLITEAEEPVVEKHTGMRLSNIGYKS